ncbi:MAG TPA: hypothetical protein VGN20_13515 [Mucilaginibacter sp.]|jgi:sugar lactone lactonase YvrE
MHNRYLFVIIFLIAGAALNGCSKKGDHPVPVITTPIVTTLAGSGTYGSANGVGAAATFAYPDAICTDAAGNIYVGDGGDYLIRKITPAGNVTTAGIVGNSGGGQVSGLAGLTIDPSGNFYFTFELASVLYKLAPGGQPVLVAGSQIGDVDGPGATAKFANLIDVVSDSQGNIFGADFANYKIRKITPSGIVSTVPGTGIINTPGSSSSIFLSVQSLALDKKGNFYVTDPTRSSVTELTAAGQVKYLASMNYPAGIAVDGSGNVYVSDMSIHVIKKIATDGTISIIAGTGTRGYKDGTGEQAQFALPQALALDPTGKILYVADAGNSVIRKIVLP